MEQNEEFEHIPWSQLADDHRDRRNRLVYLAAGGIAAFAVGVLIVRAVTSAPGEAAPSTSVIPVAAEATTTSAAATTEPDPLYSEADLMAALDTELARTVAARAEWFITDYFTSDAEPITSADIRSALPDQADIPVLHQNEAAPVERSYVEWAKATSVVELGPGRYRVTVAYRSVGGPGETIQRHAVRVVQVPVVVATDGGTRVIDLPTPIEPAPGIPLVADWPEDTESPPFVNDAALAQAWLWGVDPKIEAAMALDEAWRLLVSAVDDSGVRRSLTVWLDLEGRPLPAGFHS